MADKSFSIAEVVPQISFDIIARVLPGTVLILVGIVVYEGPIEAFADLRGWLTAPTASMNIWSFLILIAAAYVVSTTLSGISRHTYIAWVLHWASGLPSCLRKKLSARSVDADSPERSPPEDKAKIASTDPSGSSAPGKKGPSVAWKFDVIRHKFPVAGARLLKLRAENRAAQTLLTGMVVAAIVNVFSLLWDRSMARIVLELALVVAACGQYSYMKHLAERHSVSLRNHWHLVCMESPVYEAQDPTQSAASPLPLDGKGVGSAPPAK